MRYCRWGEGDFYAYNGADGYDIHVAGPAVVEGAYNGQRI